MQPVQPAERVSSPDAAIPPSAPAPPAPSTNPIVAIQGERGSFSDEAVGRYWNSGAVALPQIDCARVISAVRDGRAMYGILPMENSIAGRVAEAHAALEAAPDIVTLDEVRVPIAQCLVAPRGATLDSIRHVFSHPVALRQCGRFLGAHPRIEAHSAYDTAGAARDVAARGRVDEAAIASRSAAARYGLSMLTCEIGDDPGNETRFAVIARRTERTAPAHATNGLTSPPAPTSPSNVAPVAAPPATIGAIRGATTVEADDTLLIHEATSELLRELLHRNALTPDRVISAIFTVTADLRSEFPARAARDLGFHDVPMINALEVSVPGSLSRCIRVLLHVSGPLPTTRGHSVYLRSAATLRPDLGIGSGG